MLILEVAYCSYNAFDTVEASTFLWSQHDRPSVTTAEGTAEEFISKSTACGQVKGDPQIRGESRGT